MKKSRRRFLRDSACGLTAAAFVSSLDRFGIVNAMVQQQPDVASDYKALVCIFLSGGTDCNNMVVPYTQYSDVGGYDTIRTPSGLAVPKTALLQISPPNQGGNIFGLHPNLSPEVANPVGVAPGLLGPWSQNKLAILCSFGSLLQPTTKAQYQSNVNGAFRPYQLFSHSDQVAQQMTSISNQVGQTGWGGRVSDLTGGLNGAVPLPMNISVAGTNLFETGVTSRQLAIGTGALINVLNLNWNGPVSATPFTPGSAYRQVLGFDTDSALIKGASDTTNQALNADAILNQPDPVLTSFPASNVPGFNTGIANQLRQVAKLVSLGSKSVANGGLGFKRQIFFCSLGGFDTHTNETSANPTLPAGAGGQGNLLTQLSQAMRAFYDEMVAQGNSNSVTQFTISDFGRTFQPSGNGPGTVGSDHAWGSHALILGGAVQGGTFYGTYPTLALNSPDDDGGARGRWIPTTSIEQYAATLSAWYGLASSDIPKVFPNLVKFPVQNLGFLA
ncbi:MAG TPA: DUF1501 domain-containing protein [Pyrinomonadaceae bacterium]|nr:DUF1501 domain-containing protein [Pyrinomonadaceae bacterium]